MFRNKPSEPIFCSLKGSKCEQIWQQDKHADYRGTERSQKNKPGHRILDIANHVMIPRLSKIDDSFKHRINPLDHDDGKAENKQNNEFDTAYTEVPRKGDSSHANDALDLYTGLSAEHYQKTAQRSPYFFCNMHATSLE